MGFNSILQLIISGISLGSVYALIAVGFAIVFSNMRFSNFAHGGMISALGALWRTPVSYLADNPEAQELLWELVAWYHNDLEKGTDSVMCPPVVINEETKRAHGYV